MKGRWFQFRLRTLFVLVTMAALVTGVVRHAWYIRERVRFHEGRLANCDERLVIINSSKMRRISLSMIQQSQRSPSFLPDGHLLYFGPSSTPVPMQVRAAAPAADDIRDGRSMFEQIKQEIASVEEAKRYHQKQVEQYRHSLWRPWLRVAEDHRQELPDLPPEPVPQLAAPIAPVFPQPTFPVDDQPTRPSLPAEALRSLPELPHKIRHPWRAIERPLPFDFDEPVLQVEKAAAV